jgi:ubiquinone/menaquinone biosynthesis C-methylase UbiE
MPEPGWWEALWPEPATVLANLGLKPGMDVIDLCSGDGWFTLKIAKIARHVTAIDIDSKLLQLARSRLEEANQSNCTYVEGSAYDICALIDRQVDSVFFANIFHGVPDRPRLAKAVADTLKTGGLFVIVNWQALPRDETRVLGEPRGPATALRIGPDVVKASVEQSGLRQLYVAAIRPYHYGIVFKKEPA